ncbi:MAG: WD40 repeat domain-containing protein [Planctomycetota bacterium]|jgi:WD40 repeat protein
MKVLVWTWVTLCVLAAGSGRIAVAQEKPSAMRIWTDSTGRYTVEADLVDLKDGQVRLKKESGEVISVPLDKLSAADQQFAKARAVRVDQPADAAPVTIRCQGPVRCLALSPDGKTLASVVYLPSEFTSELKLWHAKTGRPKAKLAGHAASVDFIAFSADGKLVASQGIDERRRVCLRLWHAKTGRKYHVDVSPARGAFRNQLLDPTSGQIRSARTTWPIRIGSSVAFSADGKRASGSRDGTITVSDLARSRQQATLKGHVQAVEFVLFSPDGKTFVSACAEKTIKIWDLETNQERATLEAGKVLSLLISPDGKTLASLGRLWDLETGQERAALRRDFHVKCLGFSPDSSVLAAGCFHRLRPLRLLDLETGQELATLEGHTGTVNSVAFLPDGDTLVSGSEDGTIRLWNMSAIKERLRGKANTP